MLTVEQQEELTLLEQAKLRNDCRNNLLSWAEYLCDKQELPSIPANVRPALHHRYILSRLQDAIDGKIRKLMILVPPGAGKSVYTSIAFPTFFLNRYPNRTILACSHAHNLAQTFGRHCRNIVERNATVLGYSLAGDLQAADEWETDKKGRYFCAGVGGKIAGHRAGVGLIDDYLGSQQDADSVTMRDKVHAWFKNDFRPRLWPNAPEIIIANRRHEDDLVGRLLADENDWTVIRIPMLAEDDDVLGRKRGDRLWPDWYQQYQVDDAMKDPRVWAGLYQQRPAPEEGNFFKKDWLVEYRPEDLAAAERSGMHYYCASDHAVKMKESNDRTCLLAAGVDSSNRIWILPDWFWTRADTLEVCSAMLSMAKRRKPLRWWAGSDHITGSIGPFLRKMMAESNTYFALEEIVNTKDKRSKAQAISGRMAQKMVMFPSYAPSWAEAKHEILTFDAGTHDDFVDALGELGRGLGGMIPGTPVRKDVESLGDFKPTMGYLRKQEKWRNRMTTIGGLGK